jgi:type II secretory pathway component PulJ
MISRKTRLFHKGEAGLTLLEILVSLTIASLIGLGAAISSAQVLNETSKNNDYTTASRNAMNALYWISKDAQMAQVISGHSGFPQTSDLSLTWVEWDNSSHNATYSLADGLLWRTYTVDGESTVTLIAEYISSAANMTYCTSDNGTLMMTVTSSVGEGSRIVEVTREREMTARPRL